MIDDIAHMLELSPFALVTMTMMCLICGFMVGQLQDSVPGMLASYAGIFGCGLLGNTIARKFELFFLGNKELDAIVATTVGLICGVVLFTAIKLTLTVVYGSTRHIPKTDDEAVRSISNG